MSTGKRVASSARPRKQPAKAAAADVLHVVRLASESDEQAYARSMLRPTVAATRALKNVSRDCAGASFDSLTGELAKQCDAVIAGDLGRAEAMLITQAHTLDALFNNLITRAALNAGHGEFLTAADIYFRLALRAQNQCRATLETLATIKNPPNLAFVKQANIGQAVQVNNGSGRPARDGESERNKLLEHSNGERLDFGSTTATSRTDSALETVGAIDGTQLDGR